MVYRKIPPVRLDLLSRQVAMVKAVIKAIKAAGVGLNGSSDCSCCHKLNRKRERETRKEWERHEKMELDGKNAVRKKTQEEKKLKCG